MISNPLDISKKRARTASEYYKARSYQLQQELAKANRKRLMKEIDRPKILIEEATIDKPRPASYYITQAHKRFVSKSLQISGPKPYNRAKFFGPLLTTQMFGNAGTFRLSGTNKRSSFDSEQGTSGILPKWLAERQDYQSKIKKILEDESNISNICNIPLSSRTEMERNSLLDWVSTVPIFYDTPARVVKEICEKLNRVAFNDGDLIIREGDLGDSLYIIFSGKAEVFLEEGESLGVFGNKQALGEHVLKESKPKACYAVAIDDVIALRLRKMDYDCAVLNFQRLNNL